jgi:hypothetical protein
MPRKGYTTQPQGFNPGKLKSERFALKGREATGESRTYRRQKLECATETCHN